MVNLEEIYIYWDSSSEVVNGILKEYVFWLNCAHFTVAMMGTKQKLGKYAHQKPLMSFILSYLSCFARLVPFFNFLLKEIIMTGFYN